MTPYRFLDEDEKQRLKGFLVSGHLPELPSSPAFHMNIKSTGEVIDGANVAQIGYVGFLGLIDNAKSQTDSLENPDQAVIWPSEMEGGDYRISVTVTCFYELKNGCLGFISQDRSKSIWLLLPFGTLKSGPETLKFAEWRDAIRVRNNEFGYELPEELKYLNSSTLLLQDKSKPKLEALPKILRQPTFIESHAFTHALSDGSDVGSDDSNWFQIEGMMAMLHSPPEAKRRGLETRFEPQKPLLDWWGFAPTLESLEAELRQRDFDDVILFYVMLSGLLHTDKARWTVSIDDIIKLIGRDNDARRSRLERERWRTKIWRSLLVFDSWSIVGARRAGTWIEPNTKDNKRQKLSPQQLYSRDPLIRIVGTAGTEQFALDGSEMPKEVTVVPGEWLMRFHGDHRVLSDMGNIIQIAQISRGKPSGAWAACAGLMLNQLWREEATRATKKRVSRGGDSKVEVLSFRPFTRRELLARTIRSGQDVYKILNDENNRTRANGYWRQAVKLLQNAGVIGHYAELKAPESNDWRVSWLDQPLEIRPKEDSMRDALKISQDAANARKKGQNKLAKKKTPT